MIRQCVVIALILFVLAPPASATEPLQRPWIDVTINGNPGVLLPREAAPNLVYPESTEGYWLPGEAWLAEAEDAVFVTAKDIPDETRRPQIDGYRQYAGYMNEGQRMILINSFCMEFDDWQSRVVFVNDGGPCFWQATYNATTGELVSLMVNGHA